MKNWYAWLSERDGYVVTFVAATLGALMAFGIQMSAEQTVSITTVVTAGLAMVLGRPVQPPSA